MELPDNQIGDKREDDQSNNAGKKMDLFKQNQIPECAHGAKPTALGDKADDQSNDSRHQERGVHGTGPLEAVKQDTTLVLAFHLGIDEQKQKKPHSKRPA